MKVKSVIQTNKLRFLLPLLLLAACTGAPKDDGTSLPPSLFQQPQTIIANPDGGYAVNIVTGNSIQPIVNSLGDTLVTGVPIPARGKRIHPESVASPKVVQAPSPESLERYNAHPNRFTVPDDIVTVPVDHNQLKRITFGEGNQDFVLLSTTGDTIPTGVPIPAKGIVVKAVHPQSVNALPLTMKDVVTANLRYMDMDQGMNSANVRSVLEDSKGRIWVATIGGGVIMYDGTSYTHFTVKEGLLHDLVSSMLEDSRGHIWLGYGTSQGGVSVYDGQSFTHFTDKDGFSNNRVWSIIEDSKGHIWLGSEGSGASVYEPPKEGQVASLGGSLGSFIHFTTNEGLSSNDVISIIEDSKGHIWVGTYGGGVSVYEPQKDGLAASFTHFTEKDGLLSDLYVTSLLEDSKGNIWLGTWGGVSVYEPSKNGQAASFTHFTEKEGLSNNFVRSMAEDSRGHIWLGTYVGGVSVYEPSRSGEAASFTHFTEKEGLSNNRAVSIIEGSKGHIWLGTWAGVSVYESQSFTHFTTNEGLSSNDVISILEDSKGHIWVGTGGGGVSVYEPSKEGQAASFTHFTINEGLSGNVVLSALEDSKGRIWLGTFLGGVSVYEPPKNGQGASFTWFSDNEGLSNNTIRSITEDSRGHIWLGTDRGVSIYEPPKDGQEASFTHFTEKEGLSNNSVRSIFEDSKGHIWVGTGEGGVSVYEPSEDGQAASFTHFTEKEGLSNNSVVSILEDSKGNIWLGTWGGVSVYEPSKNGQAASFTHFTENEGLSNNTVASILEDHSGNIFVATEKGLTLIEVGGLETGEVSKSPQFTLTTFQKQDGLKGLAFKTNSVLIDNKNRMWWGSNKGLTVLDPNTLRLAQQPPVVRLKQLDINEQFIDYRDIMENPDSYHDSDEFHFNGVRAFENYPINAELPYDKNHLTFHFGAIDWAAPHKIQYSHRLLGLNTNWSVVSKESKADYRNLPHNGYTFQIRAIGESGEWSEPFEYAFVIHPPWWQTWWAYLIYTLMFLVGLRSFSLWRERKLRQEKEQLQVKVEERTGELKRKSEELAHSLKDLKSTQGQLVQQEKLASLGQLTAGIAHEIKNPLNFVNNFSEVSLELVDETKEELSALSPQLSAGDAGKVEEALLILDDIESNLRKIHEHGSRADGIVQSMLLHSRGGDGKMEPTPLNPIIKEYVNLAFHGMRAAKDPIDVDIDLQLDESIREVPLIAEDFSRVILNLCNNAFDAMRDKLPGDGGPGIGYVPKLTVRTHQSEKTITIEIEDNGPGIPDEIKDKILQPFFTTKKGTQGTGLGLSITNDIVKAHGGSLEIESGYSESIFKIILAL